MEEADFDEELGANLRKLRRGWNCSADQLATRARQYGLGWSRSTVSKIESGSRPLSARELLALVWFLDDLARQHHELTLTETGTPWFPHVPFTIEDLLPTACRMTGALSLDRHSFRELLHGVPADEDQELRPGVATASVEAKGVSEVVPVTEAAGYTEAEQRAARRLGIGVAELSNLAHSIWAPHGFVEEREWRVSQLDVDRSAARTMQAVRGQVTRALLAEIERRMQRRADDE